MNTHLIYNIVALTSDTFTKYLQNEIVCNVAIMTYGVKP